MSCKKYEKWVYLFWDERLNPEQEDEFKKHLAECGECQKSLSYLELVEGKAKQIHAKEPPQEYWDAFSGRVREKIISRKESSPSFGLKKFLENIFVISPWKMKVAAGVASIVLVFIIGKLYMDYRGKEIVPSGSISHIVKEQPLRTTEIEKKETPPTGETQGKTISSFNKPKKTPESVVSDRSREKSVSQKIKGSEKPTLLKDQEVAVPAQTAEGKSSPPSPAPQAIAITPEVAEQKASTKTPQTTGTGIKKDVESIQEERVLPMEDKARKIEENYPKLSETTRVRVTTKSASVDKALSSYSLTINDKGIDEAIVPQIMETDTLISADELKDIIQIWKDHFKDNPADSINDQGYLQVATAFLLLGRLSPDSTVFDQGSAMIEQYMNRTKDPTTKDQLSQSLEKLKALGKR